MPDQSGASRAGAATPETTAYLPGMFADLYRQEIAAEEDVHRTLPFFATALRIIIGATRVISVAGKPGFLPKVTVIHPAIVCCRL